jgi:hypothetical protein
MSEIHHDASQLTWSSTGRTPRRCPKRRSVGFEKGRASLPGHDSSSDPGSGSGSDYCRPARCWLRPQSARERAWGVGELRSETQAWG